jgi:hypothetical protein
MRIEGEINEITSLLPTHYYTTTEENDEIKFDIQKYADYVPEDATLINVGNNGETITIVDEDGNIRAEEIVPEGLEKAVNLLLNPPTGGSRRRRRSRRQSKRRQSKRRQSKRRQRR